LIILLVLISFSAPSVFGLSLLDGDHTYSTFGGKWELKDGQLTGNSGWLLFPDVGQDVDIRATLTLISMDRRGGEIRAGVVAHGKPVKGDSKWSLLMTKKGLAPLEEHVQWGKTVPFEINEDQTYEFRVRTQGKMMLGKAWLMGAPEPDRWMVCMDGKKNIEAGGVGIYAGRCGIRCTRFDVKRLEKISDSVRWRTTVPMAGASVNRKLGMVMPTRTLTLNQPQRVLLPGAELMTCLRNANIDYTIVTAEACNPEGLSKYDVLVCIGECPGPLHSCIEQWLNAHKDRRLIVFDQPHWLKDLGVLNPSADDILTSNERTAQVSYYGRKSAAKALNPPKLAIVGARHEKTDAAYDLFYDVKTGGQILCVNAPLDQQIDDAYWLDRMGNWAGVQPINLHRGDPVHARISIAWGQRIAKANLPVAELDGRLHLTGGTASKLLTRCTEERDQIVLERPDQINWKASIIKFDTDGFVFEYDGKDSDRIELSFGGSQVSWSLGEILNERCKILDLPSEHRLVLWLMPEGISLEPIPSDPPTHKFLLHVHTLFCDGAPFSYAEQVESILPYVPNVWWTNHDFWFSGDNVSDPVERPFEATSDADVLELKYAYQYGIRLSTEYQLTAKFDLKLDAPPTEDAYPGVGFCFQRWRTVNYVIAPVNASLPPNTMRLDAQPGQWQSFTVDVTGDYERFFGGQFSGSSCWYAYAGGFARKGGKIKAAIRNFELTAKLKDPFKRWRLAKEYHRRHGKALNSYQGLEITKYDGKLFGPDHPHFTIYFGPAEPEPKWIPKGDESFETQARRKYMRYIHERGGVVGWHHISGTVDSAKKCNLWDVDLVEMKYSWARQTLDGPAPALIRGYKYFEYPAHPMPLYSTLVIGDDIYENGIYATLYSAPDLHGRLDEQMVGGHAFGLMPTGCTWIYSPTLKEQDLLPPLRAGRCFFGNYHGQILLDMKTREGFPQGSVVWTDKNSHQVSMKVQGAPVDSRLCVIVNGIKVDSIPITADDSGTFEYSTAVNSSDRCFVRFEVYDTYGFPIALSNPITFVREPPADWRYGKACLSRNGWNVFGDKGLWLTNIEQPSDDVVMVTGDQTSLDGLLVVNCPQATEAPKVHNLIGRPMPNSQWNASDKRLSVPRDFLGSYQYILKR